MKLKFFRNVVANIVIGTVLALVFSITYAGGVLNAFSTSDNAPFYSGNTDSKKVSLMINVYWGTEYIEPMLTTLKKYGVKTTFFVGGMWAEKNEDILKKIFDDGHEIGNHGYFHKDQDKLNTAQNQDEIYITHQLIKTQLGIDMQLFAPPSGAFSDTTLNVAKNLGYKTIMWTRDTIDWRDKDRNVIYSRAITNAKGGDFVLMHPTEQTMAVLEQIVKYYIDHDFILTTVSENLK